ncbi:hypothetical protein Bca4012_074009 [Brassica carinata]|uniref:Helicase C-terminal domain-containing protein n=1 Tax=Brassica carinata TaxID=52824 RepID=A0A8X7QQ99_BRACI|nr:hypothetical protein Bca52824_066328 [Brassica carinata]
MRTSNFTVSSMHGDMPQKERDEIMDQFRSGDSRVLITIDVWARGIDVQQVIRSGGMSLGDYNIKCYGVGYLDILSLQLKLGNLNIQKKVSSLYFFLLSMTQSRLIGTAGDGKNGCFQKSGRLKTGWVAGVDLGHGKFQFDFELEEDIEVVLRMQPYHNFPAEIPFWVRVVGVPLRVLVMRLEEQKRLDLDFGRVKVVIDGFKELSFETTVDFTGGLEDRARSYKGVVINGNSGQKNKERDHQGKGKGKMFEEPGSKWGRRHAKREKFGVKDIGLTPSEGKHGVELACTDSSGSIGRSKWLRFNSRICGGDARFDEEFEEDAKEKENGVDILEEEKQGDEAEEKDQNAGDWVKKQGVRKKLYKPTVAAGGAPMMRLVQAAKAGAKQTEEKGTSNPKSGPPKPYFLWIQTT